jgi:lipoate-protein ligase A
VTGAAAPRPDVLRVIRDGARTGAYNMARDAELLRAQRPEDPPVLRLYRWTPPAVSLGYNQDEAAFDRERIAALGYDLVRRPTGGRAILHAEELTYAVVGASPSPLFGATLHTSYDRINRALLAFLRDLGIAAEISAGESRAAARGLVCFDSAGLHEVRVGGRKLIGSAQRRTGGVFLQHGSILTGPAHADLLRCLGGRGGDASPTDPERERSARARLLAATTDLAQLRGGTLAATALPELEDRLVAAFASSLDLRAHPETD